MKRKFIITEVVIYAVEAETIQKAEDIFRAAPNPDTYISSHPVARSWPRSRTPSSSAIRSTSMLTASTTKTSAGSSVELKSARRGQPHGGSAGRKLIPSDGNLPQPLTM